MNCHAAHRDDDISEKPEGTGFLTRKVGASVQGREETATKQGNTAVVAPGRDQFGKCRPG